ncbi:hypothetical protein HF319_00005 [Xanthomonas sp. Kuri4-1]
MENPSVVRRGLGLSLLLGLLVGAAPLVAAELEEEVINASEVTFRDGQPYYYDAGEYVRLGTRQVGGEPVYFRKVRFDRQEGYVDDRGGSVAASGRYASVAPGPVRTPQGGKYYGNGLYGPDYYNSPYNRDARQRYGGPGYFGACDWRGCREVQYAPVYYVR